MSKHPKWLGPCALSLMSALGCDTERQADPTVTSEPLVPATSAWGLVEVEGPVAMADAVAEVESALSAADLGVALSLDHQENAESVGLPMDGSHLFVFGNPRLGTPLMQENPLAALDLPLKLLIFEEPRGQVRATHDGVSYLRRRYGLSGVDEPLAAAANALARFAGAAVGAEVQPATGEARDIEEGEGLVRVESSLPPSEALAALRSAIEANPNLALLATIDHQAAARNVDLELGFSTVVYFGSAAVGTPLMQAAPSTGLDLPLKVLVAEVEGQTRLVYSDPQQLAARHGLPSDQSPRLEMMRMALSGLTQQATGG